MSHHGIRCTVNVHEPKKKGESLNFLRRVLAEIIAGKLLKFDCPPGLTIDELE